MKEGKHRGSVRFISAVIIAAEMQSKRDEYKMLNNFQFISFCAVDIVFRSNIDSLFAEL